VFVSHLVCNIPVLRTNITILVPMCQRLRDIVLQKTVVIVHFITS